MVFALGSNGSGQLGIGHKEDVSVPKPVNFLPDFQPDPIIGMAAGGNHTLLLSSNGTKGHGGGILNWSGDNTPGCCGLHKSELEKASFRWVQLPENEDAPIETIVAVAATWEASVFVATDDYGRRNRVFSFGIGMKGELGLGELIVRTSKATQIKNFPPPGFEVVDLAASMGHVVAVLSNGDAYSWGNCRKGQGGTPGEVIHAPRKINDIGFKVTRAVCGREFTCLFGESGSGNLKVLGSDKGGVISDAPQSAPEWKDVGASWGSIYILTKEGNIQGWGRDDHGQLPPPNLPKLEKIAIGSEHVVVLSEDGEVLSWGWGEHGNCGPKTENNDVKGRWNSIAKSTLLPPGSKIYGIGAGCATSFVFLKLAPRQRQSSANAPPQRP